MIQETSQISLWETICEGKINQGQKKILRAFETSNYLYLNNRQISQESGLQINVVTACVNELVKNKIMFLAKKDYDPVTNRLTIFWGITK